MKISTYLAPLIALCLCCCTPTSGPYHIDTPDGTLTLTPLTNSAVRVTVRPDSVEPLPELVYLPTPDSISYKIEKKGDDITMALPGIRATYNKLTHSLTFTDSEGEVVLSEAAGGRCIEPSSVGDEPTLQVSQTFESPIDERLYGTGQFQDGYLNVRGLTRRLNQLNTQIALPLVLSSKGYALLWNNYGLSEFNPSTHHAYMSKHDGTLSSEEVNVTTGHGGDKQRRDISLYTTEIDIDDDGDYALLLDVGAVMGSKHHLRIDGDTIIDYANLWLPSTASVITPLKAGKHVVEYEGNKHENPSINWRKVDNSTTWASPVSQGIDYTVFAGSPDDAIAAYRQTTGPVPMMPLWALGYIHCRERYDTQAELLENATEFRKRQIPIDMIVQDWQYWGSTGWNSMEFDSDKYPDPKAMTDSVHDMGMRLMLSVWSKVDRNSTLGHQIEEKGYYIPGTEWVDFFNPEAADFYWSCSRDKIKRPYGIDCWWQDAVEPENDDLVGRSINNGTTKGEIYRNAYPMMVNKTVYEGFHADDPDNRTMILTRSAFPGMQRYATATWSGDVGYDWEVLRRQIAGGLGMMASGQPWWTFDAGGFFRPSDQYTSPSYHQLLGRWIQVSAFLPLMRTHGYMSNTEPWRYGPEVEKVARQYIDLRYALLPYIYSATAAITHDGYTLMRPLVMDFAHDARALDITSQYMFGPSILVAPVLEPEVDTWSVYLPQGREWISLWTGERYAGGNTVDVAVDAATMPLMVSAGSIIPYGPLKQYSLEPSQEPVEICVFSGADATFTLYDDSGTDYGYERGECSRIPIKWDDTASTLTLGERQGSYPGMEHSRRFAIKLDPVGIDRRGEPIVVTYDGTAQEINMRQ